VLKVERWQAEKKKYIVRFIMKTNMEKIVLIPVWKRKG
jgi:hypothetical protein